MEIVRINFVGKNSYKNTHNCIFCSKTVNEPNYCVLNNNFTSKIHKSKCGCVYHSECYNRTCPKHSVDLESEYILDSETLLPIINKYTRE